MGIRSAIMSQETNPLSKRLDFETPSDFDAVLTTAIRVSQRAAGVPTNRVVELASQLLTQNVITSLTIASLVHPAPCSVIAGLPDGCRITDLPSLCILTRGVVETYLTMFYLAVQPVAAPEREFRLLWWDWHEVNERVWSLDQIGSKAKKLESYRKKRSELRSKIANHACYSHQSKTLRTDFERLKSPRDALLMSKTQIAEAAGIHTAQFRVLYKVLSEYAHAQPLAVSILLGLSATSPEIHLHFQHAARHATSYLLFSVRDFLRVFPQGRDFTDEKFWELVAVWSAVHTANLANVKL